VTSTRSIRGTEDSTTEAPSELALLVDRAKSGDRVAFGEIFQLRVSTVQRYVGSIVRDPERTQDAVAETFIDVWKSLPKLRDAERFDGWLLKIAHRRSMDELRKVRPSVALEDAPEVVDERRDSSPEAVAEASADAEVVRGALAELPEPQREVVTLRYLQDLSYSEIAKQVGRSNDAVRQLHQRGMARLRRQLATDTSDRR
jgi:RNA polymerase sigma-70 factor, ECF subfamily